jgi:hypothetical protein
VKGGSGDMDSWLNIDISSDDPEIMAINRLMAILIK